MVRGFAFLTGSLVPLMYHLAKREDPARILWKRHAPNGIRLVVAARVVVLEVRPEKEA